LVKVFCCTLIHCFSTVNIFDHGGDIQGRLAMSGDDSEQGMGLKKKRTRMIGEA
jgi:hypothetical protein